MLGAFVTEFRQTARLKETWAGILVCTLPTGTWALMFFLPSLGETYHATASVIASVNGALSWVLCALGGVVGGFLCARLHRYRVYMLVSLAAVVNEIVFALAPARPAVYIAFALVFFFLQGVQLASAEAVIFSVLKHSRQSTCLQFNLFRSVNYFSSVYVTMIDTKMSGRFGVRGLLMTDSLLIGVGLLGLFLVLRHFNAQPAPGKE